MRPWGTLKATAATTAITAATAASLRALARVLAVRVDFVRLMLSLRFIAFETRASGPTSLQLEGHRFLCGSKHPGKPVPPTLRPASVLRNAASTFGMYTRIALPSHSA